MLNVYLRIRNYIEGLLRREEGQTLTEYALILVLIAIVVIVVLGLLGDRIQSVFSQITSALEGA